MNVARWFRDDDGRQVVAQWPNPALWVWFVALALGWFDLPDAQARSVDGIRQGALVVWALDELVRGAAPFRRVLGAVVLTFQLAAIIGGTT